MRVSSRPNLYYNNNGSDGGSPSALVPSAKTMAPLPVSPSRSEPVFDSGINSLFTLELSSGYRSLDFTTIPPLIVKDDDHDNHSRDQRSSLITGLHERSVFLQKDSHTVDDCWPMIHASKHSSEFATTKNDLHYPELIIQPYIYSSPTGVHITKGALNDIKHYQNSWAEAGLQFNPSDTTGYVVLNNHPNDGSLPNLIKVDGPIDGNIRPDVDLDCYSLEYQETMPPYDLCPSTTVPYASFYEASLKN
ncbi:hypothetical protein BDQ12DRAFT_448037 [Crucibulum laeve]|uniref:Uncharacterized protein n=1 Tax=Crucibulum laeve TaxID=68775 RepID=A0A5C3LKA7_9AGAR|nr:hypothetical protein BDQ12DRAFT_448037 [Crucibulum laeve]